MPNPQLEKLQEIVTRWHKHCCFKAGDPCIAADGMQDEVWDLMHEALAAKEQEFVEKLESLKEKDESDELTIDLGVRTLEHFNSKIGSLIQEYKKSSNNQQ